MRNHLDDSGEKPKKSSYNFLVNYSVVDTSNLRVYVNTGLQQQSSNPYFAINYIKDINLPNSTVADGKAVYDLRIYNSSYNENNTVGYMDANYTTVQVVKKGKKKYTLYSQGQIRYTAQGTVNSPINHNIPFPNIVKSEIQTVAATNLVVEDKYGNKKNYKDVYVKFKPATGGSTKYTITYSK